MVWLAGRLQSACAGLAIGLLATAAMADASGPEFYRVIEGELAEALSIRTGPSPDVPAIMRLPAQANGLMNFERDTAPNIVEWEEMTEAERSAAFDAAWRLTGYDRAVGWAPARYLAEDGPPDSFRGGGTLRSLAGSEWRVVRIGAELVESEARIAFKSDGRMGGNAGCNQVSGQYTEETEGALSLGPLATTRRGCPGPSMELESRILAALAQTKIAVATHLVLALLGEDGDVLIQFARTDHD